MPHKVPGNAGEDAPGSMTAPCPPAASGPAATSVWVTEKQKRRLGRNDFPALLAELCDAGELEDRDELAAALEDAWTMADLPLRALRRRDWVALFRYVGYIVDSARAEASRPSEPVELYRAATRHDLRTPGLAWTPDIARAKFFQRYNQRYVSTPIVILRATALPHHFLARFNRARGEDEHLVNVSNRALKITVN